MTEERSLRTWPALMDKIRARTPARVLVDRAGACYRSSTQLELRAAHAAARDAVRAELNMEHDLGLEFIRHWELFEAQTRARSKDEYLLRPDTGRWFSDVSARQISSTCPHAADLRGAGDEPGRDAGGPAIEGPDGHDHALPLTSAPDCA